MERLRRLTTLWNFLPGFRVVAEAEHLPTASELLHVSPSALSRTIRLLEEDVGRPLFDRVGRNIELNAAGARLLSGVRDAMRLVDEVLAEIGDQRLIGPVYVACSSPIAAALLMPALERVREAHPALVPTFRDAGNEDVEHLLLRGQIDLAIGDRAIGHADLEVQELRFLQASAYASKTHALAGKKRLTLAEIAEHAFAAPEDDDDGWPPAVPRRVVVRGRLSMRLEACLAGSVVAVLPDAVAEKYGLVALHTKEIAGRPLFAVRRRALLEGDKASVLLAALRTG